MITPPCYNRELKMDCPDRKVGCASTCEKWATYVALRDEYYEKRARIKRAKAIQRDYRFEVHNKLAKKYGKGEMK